MSPKEETTSFKVILNQLVEWGPKFRMKQFENTYLSRLLCIKAMINLLKNKIFAQGKVIVPNHS